MAALAAIIGIIDVMGDVQIRNLSDAWLHAGGNIVAMVIELYNWYSRYEHGTAAVVPTGLILSLCRGFDPSLYRLEGLGDGLSSSCRCDGPVG